jgi:hypothetical protein
MMSILDEARRERTKAHAERNGQAYKERSDERARVVLGTDEHRVTAEAEAVLAANARGVYQRGRQLVQVLHHKAEGKRQRIRRPESAPVVRNLPSPILREELSRHVQFVTITQTKHGPVESPAHVPGYAVSAIHARGVWKDLPHLEGVVSHSVLLPDGTILATPGYHADSGLLL